MFLCSSTRFIWANWTVGIPPAAGCMARICRLEELRCVSRRSGFMVDAYSCYLSESSRFRVLVSSIIVTVIIFTLHSCLWKRAIAFLSLKWVRLVDSWWPLPNNCVCRTGFSSWLREAFNLIGSSCGSWLNSTEFSSLLLTVVAFASSFSACMTEI